MTEPNISKYNNFLSQKTILLVNTGSPKKRFILQKLKKLGLTIVVLNKEKNWAQPYIDNWILADTTNHIEAIHEVENFLTQNPQIIFNGILTFWEDDVLLTSKLTDKYKLTGISYEIAKRMRNKFLFREFCVENQLPAPKHIILRTENEIKKIETSLKFPLVIKPTYGSSSAYVMKVENIEELIQTYFFIKNNLSIDVESALTDGLEILVEEYITGHEVDIDILIQNGKIKFYSISDNDQTNEPFFIETGQSIPSILPKKEQTALIEMAEEVLEKIGVQNGCIHFEAKSTKTGPVPIEVNLRMGGDEVYSFVKGAWGIDLIENALKIACGIYINKINKPEVPNKYITGKYFLSEHSGILIKLNISEEIKKHKALEEICFYKEVGDPILVPPEGYEYLGWITVSGNNLLEAKDNLEKLTQLIKYEVSKFDPNSSLGKTKRKKTLSFASINKDVLIRNAKLEKIKNISINNQRSLKIGIIGNNYQTSFKKNHDGVFGCSDLDVQKKLKSLGYKVQFFNFNNITKAFNDIRKSDVDLIFNLCEKINNSKFFELNVAAMLEAFQIPYIGSNPLTLGLCKDKIKFKKILNFHNIPTPKWDYIFDLNDEIDNKLKFPLIVKPAHLDNSIGISNNSVVTNKMDLKKQLENVMTEFKMPILIEEYIEGDEYDVSILGSNADDLRVLPLARSIFSELPPNYWHIYSFEAKHTNDPIYKKIILQQPAKKINKKLQSLLTEIAIDTYNIFDCHDYGKVEIRVDKNNNPYILELNPNTSLAQDTLLVNAAKLIKLNYGDLLEEIIYMAINRQK